MPLDGKVLTPLSSPSLAETGRALQSEPPRADSLRVPRPGGPGVQPAPAGARGHAPLQTAAADLLALVTVRRTPPPDPAAPSLSSTLLLPRLISQRDGRLRAFSQPSSPLHRLLGEGLVFVLFFVFQFACFPPKSSHPHFVYFRPLLLIKRALNLMVILSLLS